MTGIAGVYVAEGRATEPAQEAFWRRSRTEATTGADYEVNGPVGLGHQHFATTPEETGERQPIERGGVWLTLDGRLDDRDALLARLPEDHLPTGRDATDAELIVAAYHEWGEDAFDRLVGVFALTLWDADRETLFLARGPSGIRHLYYSTAGDAVRFGSDVRTVLADRGVSEALNEPMLCEYLLGDLNASRETFYEDVQRVDPGTYVRVDSDVTVRRFWEPGGVEGLDAMDDSELVAELKSRMVAAIESRYRSTTTPRIMLSGGLDSTTITGLLDTELPEKTIRAVSMVFGEPEMSNESTVASVEKSRVEAFTEAYDVDCEFLELDDVWVLQDESIYREPAPTHPRLNEVAGANTRLYEHVADDGCRVVVTGGGGNFFDGNRHVYPDLAREGRLRELVSDLRADGMSTTFLLKWYVLAPLFPRLTNRLLFRGGGGKTHGIPGWLDSSFVEQSDLDGRPIRRPTDVDLGRSSRQLTYDMMYRSDREFLWARARTDSLARGVERRHPYYDRRLVDFLFSLPTRSCFRAGESKYLFRRVADDLLPKAVRDQSHKGRFDSIVHRGLVDEERETVETLLSSSELERRGIVDGREMDQLLNGYFESVDHRKTPVWRLLATELWLRSETTTTG